MQKLIPRSAERIPPPTIGCQVHSKMSKELAKALETRKIRPTGWFPPAKPDRQLPDREFIAHNMDVPPNIENGPDPLGEDY